VLDKTGTITKGAPEVTDISPSNSYSQKEVLGIVASLENYSEHPLAQAVVARAQKDKIALQDVSGFAAIEGKGLKGTIGKVEYYVGNLTLVKERGIKADESIVNTFASQGKTPVVLMNAKKIIAYFGIADTVKPEAREVVRALHAQNIKVAMLTGDNTKTANYIAKQVGIDTVIAEVLPADKAGEIRTLIDKGFKVAMVGDGINDAPALATAHVGIAMGTGTDVAIESAGLTLLSGQLSKLPKAISLSRSTLSVIKQNLFWAFFYNIIGIPVAAGVLYPVWGILLNPAIAGAAMGFSSVSVVMNSLRLKTTKI
jgi:heavy metal translocating P-type ATPase